MSHNELCARAAVWLAGTMRCGVVLTELATAAMEIPDAIGWRGAHSILVECKTSRADFRADRHKCSRRRHGGGLGRERWYFTESGLLKPEEIPDGWGLAELRKGRIYRVVHAPPAEVNMMLETLFLVSALRRTLHGLGAEAVVSKAVLGPTDGVQGVLR